MHLMYQTVYVIPESIVMRIAGSRRLRGSKRANKLIKITTRPLHTCNIKYKIPQRSLNARRVCPPLFYRILATV